MGDSTMKCIAILVLVVALVAAKSTQKRRHHSTPFIVGGEDSAKGKWPWQLSLQVTDDNGGFRHTCGAVLIHPRYALCAAHCLMFADEAYPEDYEILAGAFNVAPGSRDAEQVIKIDTWALHPEFSNTECARRWREAPIVGLIHPILDVHICVGDDDGTLSACQGDSGGPMSCMENGKWVVSGVTSRGWPDCEIFPSVYTRVSSYTSWINGIIGSQ